MFWSPRVRLAAGTREVLGRYSTRAAFETANSGRDGRYRQIDTRRGLWGEYDGATCGGTKGCGIGKRNCDNTICTRCNRANELRASCAPSSSNFTAPAVDAGGRPGIGGLIYLGNRGAAAAGCEDAFGNSRPDGVILIRR